MEDFSEEAIRANCPHCDTSSSAFSYPLEETEYFHIVCDSHPLVEGHILIIPKAHHAAIGEYSNEELAEFKKLYQQVYDFIHAQYGGIAVFEHGKLGQTVFHSHVHFLPFSGTAAEIVPEGEDKYQPLEDIAQLRGIYTRDGGYLFFGIDDQLWTVDPTIAAPRFFRDRFANALGGPERGNWKIAHHNPHMMHTMSQENHTVQKLWRKR